MILLLTGYCWGQLFPINKKIWTSSYTLVAAGWALSILSLLIYFIEFKDAKGAWSRFFDVFGKNPLFIFVLSGVVPRILWLIHFPTANGYTDPLGWFYEKICVPLSMGKGENASLFYALTLVALYWLLARALDKKKIYIRV
jgi:predicted acyltransferase